MPFFIKKDPTRNAGISWPQATGFFVKTDPSRSSSSPWRSITAAFVKISSTEWKQFWGAQYSISQEVDIALSSEVATQYYILTGTNYKWTPNTPNPPDASALTYKFTWYDGTTTTTLAGPTKIPNGSLTGTTYSPSAVNPISPSHFSANVSNVYTFYVEAPDGTISSKAIAVQGPTDITLTQGAITTTTFDISWTYSLGASSYLVYQSEDGLSYSLVHETTSNSATITDLLPGTTYYFYVTPITGLDSTAPGYYGNNSNIVTNSTTTGNALVPIFGTNTSTSGGFTGSVTNYSASWTWTITASSGSVSWGTPVGSVRPFTVSGLGINSPSTVTVTTTRSGYQPGSANTTFSSLAGSGLVPTFGTVTSTATGFNSSVTNYNANWTWSTPTAEDGTLYETSTLTAGGTFTWGTASGSTRPFSITGFPPGTSITALITTTRTNYDPGSASITGSSTTGNARTPTFGPNTSTSTGFTGYVNNYDSNWTWTLNGIERGTFTWGTPSGTNYPFTVTGLTPGQGATLGIRSSRVGYTDGLGSTTGYASVTITYSGNGNTGGSTASTTGTLPLTVASNGFTRTGYAFRSWNTSANGTDTVYNPGDSYNLNANLSLFAIWGQLYTVTWDANGGTVTPTSSTQTTYGGTVTAPTPTRSGFTFNGWYTATSGGSLAVSGGGSYTPTANTTLYAQWTANNLTAPTPSSVSGSPGNISVSFSGGSGPNYQVYWNTTGTTPTATTYDASGSSSPITVTNISSPVAGTTYYFFVRSVATTTTTGSGPSSTISNWSSTSASIIGGRTPTFGATSPIQGGFSGSVTNYDSNWSWSGSASNSATFTWGTPSGTTYPFTVTGLSNNASSTVTVTASRSGYTTNSATVSGTATPKITKVVQQGGGSVSPFMSWTITAINASSVSAILYRGTTTPPTTTATTTVNNFFISTGAGGLNWYYYAQLTPWSGTNATGTSGTQVTTTILRNTSSSATSTNNY